MTAVLVAECTGVDVQVCPCVHVILPKSHSNSSGAQDLRVLPRV